MAFRRFHSDRTFRNESLDRFVHGQHPFTSASKNVVVDALQFAGSYCARDRRVVEQDFQSEFLLFVRQATVQ